MLERLVQKFVNTDSSIEKLKLAKDIESHIGSIIWDLQEEILNGNPDKEDDE